MLAVWKLDDEGELLHAVVVGGSVLQFDWLPRFDDSIFLGSDHDDLRRLIELHPDRPSAIVDPAFAARGFHVDLERTVGICDERRDELTTHTVRLDVTSGKLEHHARGVPDRRDRILDQSPSGHGQAIGIFDTLIAALHVLGKEELCVGPRDHVACLGAVDPAGFGVEERVAAGRGAIEVQRPPGNRGQHQGRRQSGLNKPSPRNELARRRILERAQQPNTLCDDELPRERVLRLKLVGALERREKGGLLGRHERERPVPAKPAKRLNRPGHRRGRHPKHHAPANAQPNQRRHRPQHPGDQHERGQPRSGRRRSDPERQHRSGSDPKPAPILGESTGVGAHWPIVAPGEGEAPGAGSSTSL